MVLSRSRALISAVQQASCDAVKYLANVAAIGKLPLFYFLHEATRLHKNAVIRKTDVIAAQVKGRLDKPSSLMGGPSNGPEFYNHHNKLRDPARDRTAVLSRRTLLQIVAGNLIYLFLNAAENIGAFTTAPLLRQRFPVYLKQNCQLIQNTFRAQ